MSLKDGLNNIINGAFYGISCILKSSEKFTTVTEICLKTINSMPLPIWVSRKDESEIN